MMPDSKKRPAFKAILFRVTISTLLVSIFFVLTQDLQIFPGVVRGLATTKGEKRTSLPPYVRSSYITAADGESLEVWRVAADKSDGPLALVFHGNAESVESTFHIQKWLRAKGISSYSIDYRGYGRSTGWPSEAGMYLDTDALVALVQSENDLTSRKLIVWGHSIGSGFAAYAATKTSSHALVLLSPYSSLRQVIREVPVFGFLAPLAWYEVPVSRFVAETKTKCLIALHGANDSTILPAHSEKIISVAPHEVRAKRLLIASAAHNDVLAKGIAELSQELDACLMPSQS
jgi:acetyl esterase/lipase